MTDRRGYHASTSVPLVPGDATRSEERMTSRRIAAAPLVAATLVAASCLIAIAPRAARADIAPPHRTACYDKKVGDACGFGAQRTGTCTLQLCTNRVGDPFDCVLCVETTPDGSAPRVEQPPSFAEPLFDVRARATSRPATTAPTTSEPRSTSSPSGPTPVTGGGCGRCTVSAGTPDDRRRAISLVFVAAIVVARRASRTKRISRRDMRRQTQERIEQTSCLPVEIGSLANLGEPISACAIREMRSKTR